MAKICRHWKRDSIFKLLDLQQFLSNLSAEIEFYEYNNNVHFSGVRFICDPHLAIIGSSEARADLMAR